MTQDEFPTFTNDLYDCLKLGSKFIYLSDNFCCHYFGKVLRILSIILNGLHTEGIDYACQYFTTRNSVALLVRNYHYSKSIRPLIDGRFSHFSHISCDHPETNVISSLLCPGLPSLCMSLQIYVSLCFAAVVNANLCFFLFHKSLKVFLLVKPYE